MGHDRDKKGVSTLDQCEVLYLPVEIRIVDDFE